MRSCRCRPCLACPRRLTPRPLLPQAYRNLEGEPVGPRRQPPAWPVSSTRSRAPARYALPITTLDAQCLSPPHFLFPRTPQRLAPSLPNADKMPLPSSRLRRKLPRKPGPRRTMNPRSKSLLWRRCSRMPAHYGKMGAIVFLASKTYVLAATLPFVTRPTAS